MANLDFISHSSLKLLGQRPPSARSTQSAGTTPAAPSAPAHSPSYYSAQSHASRSTTLNASSLAPTQPVASTPATNFAPAASSFQRQTRSSNPRSNFVPKVLSPLAAPQSVARNPTTTSAARPPSRHRAPSASRRSTRSTNASPLLIPPQSDHSTLATGPSATFSPLQRSKPRDDFSPTKQLIAELEETAAYLDRQYHDGMRGVNLMVQDYVFPYTLSLADDAKKANQKVEKVTKQIAAVDREWSKFHALWYEECENFDQAEEALKRAQWVLEKTNQEVARLQAYLHKLQTGQTVNGDWEQRVIKPLQPGSQPSQPVAEQPEEGGSASPAAATWSQKVKKVVLGFAIEVDDRAPRYPVPRAVQTAVKSDEADRRPERNQGQGADSATPNPSQWIKSGPGLIGSPNQNDPRASPLPNLSRRPTCLSDKPELHPTGMHIAPTPRTTKAGA